MNRDTLVMSCLAIVYGTRPEYLKVLPIIQYLKKQIDISYSIIRIVQHENLNETDLIHDYIVQIEENSVRRLDDLGSQIIQKLGILINNFNYLLVQGDTATSFYSALCAFQNRVQVIHLEAGMRTYSLENPYPEEGYRQMISRIAYIHLAPHEINSKLLHHEKVSGDIFTVGNTILDLVKNYNINITQGNKIIITFHRRENYKYLSSFIENLRKCIYKYSDKEFYWLLHPNKKLQEEVKSYIQQTDCKINFIEPCSHKDFLDLAKDCYCLLTDSGGIQEEASFLGKCSIVLREETERDQIPYPYIQLCKPPYANLGELVSNIPNRILEPCFVYGDGNSTNKIINIIRNYISL